MTEVKNSFGKTVFESRWGFHPCSHEDFLKFKVLHKQAWSAMRLAMKHHRWFRKRPENQQGSEPEISDLQQRMVLGDLEMKEFYQRLLMTYRRARMPMSTPDEVPGIVAVDVFDRQFP